MKIDIIHATAGEGHRKIAIAIQDAFARSGRADLQVRLLNCLDYASPALQKTYAPLYYWAVTNAPGLWGWFYEVLDHAWVYALVRPFRALTNSFHAKKLLKDIVENQPDVPLKIAKLPSVELPGPVTSPAPAPTPAANVSASTQSLSKPVSASLVQTYTF